MRFILQKSYVELDNALSKLSKLNSSNLVLGLIHKHDVTNINELKK